MENLSRKIYTTWGFPSPRNVSNVLSLDSMMTSAQVVETSVTVADNSPFQDYPHSDDYTTRSTVTPEFKPFTVFRPLIKPIQSVKLVISFLSLRKSYQTMSRVPTVVDKKEQWRCEIR